MKKLLLQCAALINLFSQTLSNSFPSQHAGDVIDKGCGSLQELTAASGGFYGGNYPRSYDSDMSCCWRIPVVPDKVQGDAYLPQLIIGLFGDCNALV